MPGLGRNQGGPSYSVPRLCSELRAAGTPVRLCAVESPSDPPLEGLEADFARHDFASLPVIGKLRASKSLQSMLEKHIPAAAVVHAHGIWLMPNVYAGTLAHRFDKPLVISPRGMLAPEALKISSARKRAFWKLLQGRAYSGASLWHATCEAEADEIRAFGIRAPIAIIPNGIDLPARERSSQTSDEASQVENTVLFLGRVHPKKGLTTLIEAWTKVSPAYPAWRLRIVGPEENGHAGELRALADRLGARGVAIEPAVFGREKEKALADATLFVLPTLNENFGIAVAEALGASVPAIVTKGAPWSGLATEKCGWWIEHGATPLASALHAAMGASTSELDAMGERGRAWMARDFSWTHIAQGMRAVYDWIAKGGTPPANVRLN
ncbi:MAG: glycosyltransferase [Hyphomonadaceae bacterium]